MEHYIWKTKVLDGSMSLGRGNIVAETVKVNGAAIPDGMVIDHVKGLISWKDQKKLGDPGPYVFEFDYEPPQVVKELTADEKLDALMDKLLEKELITAEDKDAVTTTIIKVVK